MAEYPTPAGDSLEPLVRQLRDQQRQLNDLQRPSGTNIASLVEQVQQTLANINAQVAAAIAANSYTRAQVDSRIANPGTVTATGDISAPNVIGGNVFAQSIATNITTGRVTVWGRTSDGFLGTATSSRRFKTNIRPSGIDPYAVIQVEDVLYNYIAEVRKRDDPTYEEYVGPEYHVATEVGGIAEQLHELGLWQFVIYERTPEDGALILGDNGEPIPYGIHYEMLVMAIFPVLRMQQARLEDIETRLNAAGL